MKTSINNIKYPFLSIVIVGNSKSGKTEMINSFFRKTFGYNRNKSLTKDYEEISHRINDNKQSTKIKIKIWDSPSSEGYQPIVISQIKFTHGLLLVYDITNIQSFLHLDEWMKTIINNKEINKSNDRVN